MSITPGFYNVLDYQGRLVDLSGGFNAGANFNPVISFPANGGLNQQWQLFPTGSANEFILINQQTIAFLTYPGSATSGPAGNSAVIGSAEVDTAWEFVPLSGGFNIREIASGLVLTAWINPDPAHSTDPSAPACIP